MKCHFLLVTLFPKSYDNFLLDFKIYNPKLTIPNFIFFPKQQDCQSENIFTKIDFSY